MKMDWKRFGIALTFLSSYVWMLLAGVWVVVIQIDPNVNLRQIIVEAPTIGWVFYFCFFVLALFLGLITTKLKF